MALEEPVCGVLLGDVLWAKVQLAPKSNTDSIVALAFIMSDPSGKMVLIKVSLGCQIGGWNPVLSLGLGGDFG